MDFGSGFPSGSQARIRASLGIDGLLNGKADKDAANTFSKRNIFNDLVSPTIGLKTAYVSDMNADGSIANRIHSGFWQHNSATKAKGYPTDGGDGTWFNVISSTHDNASAYFALQLAANFFQNSDFYIRSTANSGTTSWNKLWHNGNLDPADYLKRVGSNSLELGDNSGYTYIDFHSSWNADFNARIGVSGGDPNSGSGTLEFYAAAHYFNSRPTFAGQVPWDSGNLVPLKKFVGIIAGDGSKTSFDLTHNLNTEDFTYNVTNSAGETSLVDVVPNGMNAAVLRMGRILPAGETRKVVIVG